MKTSDINGITTVICDKCNRVLRKGIEGSGVETKTCTSCVIKSYPAANPNSIKKIPTGSDFVDGLIQKNENMRKLEESKNNEKDHISVEIESSIIKDGDKFLFNLNFTIGKVKSFDVAFGKDQLIEFLEDLNRIEKEELLK